MGGRADFEERRKRRIDRYNELSKKANNEAIARSNSNANKILNSTLGQPILVGHHSENAHRRLIKKANNDIKKSIEASKKSDYYASRAKNMERSQVIYNDDPMAIEKLKDKLERLEAERKAIKSREHEKWELINIGGNIRETKRRLARLEELEKIEFPEIKFNGGRAIHNKDINRIQLLFDEKPDPEVRQVLKSNGFHWSKLYGVWQREFNQTSIFKTKDIISILEKQSGEELE